MRFYIASFTQLLALYTENGRLISLPMNTPAAWNLPADFVPFRQPVSDEVKATVRPMLGENEPVILSLTNDEGGLTLVGTPLRLLSIKTGELGAGAAGVKVRDFPWEGITRIVSTPLSFQLKIALHFRSTNGRTVEVGRRAQLAKAQIENLAGFDLDKGNALVAAMMQIWESKRDDNLLTGEVG